LSTNEFIAALIAVIIFLIGGAYVVFLTFWCTKIIVNYGNKTIIFRNNYGLLKVIPFQFIESVSVKRVIFRDYLLINLTNGRKIMRTGYTCYFLGKSRRRNEEIILILTKAISQQKTLSATANKGMTRMVYD
jgi:hypothetical protein